MDESRRQGPCAGPAPPRSGLRFLGGDSVPASPAAPRFQLSPSTIARYYFLDCERQLRYAAAPMAERAAAAYPTGASITAPLCGPSSPAAGRGSRRSSGGSWPGVSRSRRGNRPSPSAASACRPRSTSCAPPARPLRLLAHPARPQSFYAVVGLDPALVTLGDNHPDLIEVRTEGGVRARLLRAGQTTTGSFAC